MANIQLKHISYMKNLIGEDNFTRNYFIHIQGGFYEKINYFYS